MTATNLHTLSYLHLPCVTAQLASLKAHKSTPSFRPTLFTTTENLRELYVNLKNTFTQLVHSRKFFLKSQCCDSALPSLWGEQMTVTLLRI